MTDTTTNPTYSTSVDVGGITTLSLTPNFLEKELRGDEAVLDRYSRLETITFTFEHSYINLDALAVILGGAVAASGATPNQKQTFTLLSTDVANYFKIEGQSKYADVGDVHVTLFKCKANKCDYELVGEDYAKVSVSGMAIPCISNSKLKEIVFNESATAIV